MAQPPTVLVVGAGVVGLAVAALLARGRCADRLRVLVLDARPLPRWRAEDFDPRVYALSRASQQLLEQVGVWQRVALARAAPYRRMRVWEGPDAFAPSSIDFDSADIGEPDLGHDRRGLAAAHGARRSARGRAAGAAPGRGGDRVGDGSRTRGRRRAAQRRQRARHGPARRRRQRLRGTPPRRPARHRASLRADRDRHARRELGFAPRHGVAAVLARRPARVAAARGRALLDRLVAADGRGRALARRERRGVSGRAQRRRARAPSASSRRARSASASRCKRCTRCATPRRASRLLGDAAHTVHPLAGQGMNLGLLDAAAIAAVIEDALLAGEDVGDLKVLRRYERDRKGDNLAMLAVFDGLNRLFGLPASVCTVALVGAACRRSDTSCQTPADAEGAGSHGRAHEPAALVTRGVASIESAAMSNIRVRDSRGAPRRSDRLGRAARGARAELESHAGTHRVRGRVHSDRQHARVRYRAQPIEPSDGFRRRRASAGSSSRTGTS